MTHIQVTDAGRYCDKKKYTTQTAKRVQVLLARATELLHISVNDLQFKPFSQNVLIRCKSPVSGTV